MRQSCAQIKSADDSKNIFHKKHSPWFVPSHRASSCHVLFFTSCQLLEHESWGNRACRFCIKWHWASDMPNKHSYCNTELIPENNLCFWMRFFFVCHKLALLFHKTHRFSSHECLNCFLRIAGFLTSPI